ncbi:MAG TPA: glutaredoxin family protein [Deltaproteobacteria bacterium]|nr:glutaredoxin family protein [Candidatus Binatota bacterium]HIL12090.1 glutaredoxin family protein [Deltaproteobacteria bacterium]
MTTVAVTLYVKTGCPYCSALRGRLQAEGKPFSEINVLDQPERVPELLKLSGGERIVPVLVDGGRVEVAPEGG